MAEDYEDMTEPVWPDLVFGDGAIAQLIGTQYDESPKGRTVVLTFRPTLSMRQKWKIKQEEVDYIGRMTKEYPAEHFYRLDSDPKWGCALLEVDFNGNPTEVSYRHEKILIQLNTFKQLNTSLKAQLAFVLQQSKLATSEQAEFDKLALKKIGDYGAAIKKVQQPEGEEDKGLSTDSYLPKQLENF